MNIRMSQAGDAKSISDLAMKLTRKYVVPEFSDEAAQRLLTSLSEKGITNCIKNQVVYHIAEDNEQIIGLIGIHDNRHVYHLFVDEAHQRKGIARQLWNIGRDLCRLNGNEDKITVNSSIYAAAAYKKLGFIAVSDPQERNGIVTIAMEYRINS